MAVICICAVACEMSCFSAAFLIQSRAPSTVRGEPLTGEVRELTVPMAQSPSVGPRAGAPLSLRVLMTPGAAMRKPNPPARGVNGGIRTEVLLIGGTDRKITIVSCV